MKKRLLPFAKQCQGDGSLDTFKEQEEKGVEGVDMLRQAGVKSESGYYHIRLRGIGKQNIFEDQENREKFL